MHEVSQHRLIHILFVVIGAFVIQFLAHILVPFVVRRIVKQTKGQTKLDVRKRQKTLTSIFRATIWAFIWIVAICSILEILGINIQALLTGAGLIGVIAALSAQNTVKDLLAGVFILFEKQYRVGDVITLAGGTTGAGATGTVEDITLRITKLRDTTGQLITVRNGEPTVIINQTFSFSNIVLDIKFTYDSDVAAIERVMNTVGAKLVKDAQWERFFNSPIKFLRVNDFADNGIVVRATGVVSPSDQWTVAGEYRLRLFNAVAKQPKVKLAHA